MVFAADDAVATGLAVAIRSAVSRFAPGPLPEIYVLDNGLSESSRRRLSAVAATARRGATIRWTSVQTESLPSVSVGSHLTSATYCSLLVPHLLPAHVRRAVYLDVDVLVRRDLSPLFAVDLGAALLGAVRDFEIESTNHEGSGVRDRSLSKPYFNAGVLVMDVPAWREARVAEQALEYAARGEDPLRWGDQDALNAVIDAWHELDRRWNVQVANLDLSRGRLLVDPLYRERWRMYLSAAVLHFVGRSKPWQDLCSTPGTRAWVATFLRTGWLSRKDALLWSLRRLRRLARRRLTTTSSPWRLVPETPRRPR